MAAAHIQGYYPVVVGSFVSPGGGGDNDGFVTRHDQNGVHQWSRRISTQTSGQQEYMRSVATDPSGNVYVLGDWENTSASNTRKLLLLKLNQSGTLLWQRQIDNPSISDTAGGVAVDDYGNAYVTGTSHKPGVGGTDADAFVAKYDSSGALVWQRFIRTGASDTAGKVAVLPSGYVVVPVLSNVTGSSRTSVFHLAPDGSGLGTYGPFDYSAGALTTADASEFVTTLAQHGWYSAKYTAYSNGDMVQQSVTITSTKQ